MLACPVCNSKAGSYSAHSTWSHKRLGNGQFEGSGCHHQFAFYDGLKVGIKAGTFGILGVYSNWSWTTEVVTECGRVDRLDVPVLQGMSPFATYLTVYSSERRPATAATVSIVGYTGNTLVYSTAVPLGSVGQPAGGQTEIGITVYCRMQGNSEGWRRLLYDSLTDLSLSRHNLSIFKLATSVELYVDRLFGEYLDKIRVTEKLKRRLMKSARDWASRVGRIGDILPDFLQPSEIQLFKNALSAYSEKVREPRNAFAHDEFPSFDYYAATAAHEAAFDILWVLDRLADSLVYRKIT